AARLIFDGPRPARGIHRHRLRCRVRDRRAAGAMGDRGLSPAAADAAPTRSRRHHAALGATGRAGMTSAADPSQQRPPGNIVRRLLIALPLVLFIGLVVAFVFRLGNDDPSRLPSALIGRPAPATVLPPLDGLNVGGAPVPGLTAEALSGHVSVVN